MAIGTNPTIIDRNPVSPISVWLGQSPSGSNQPYTTGQSTTLGPETVRAAGTGPGDAAWRQNLATYAGGQFMKPGGSLNFNPTDPNSFPGSPTGAGNAPVQGAPTSLVQSALSGQPFSWAPPPSPAPSPGGNDWRFWINRWRDQGKNLKGLMS